jgi:amidase
MLSALRERKISSVELLDLHQRRIALYNPQLNAIVIRNEDAEVEALAADADLSQGVKHPLLGLPVTIKDALDVAGLPTTSGQRRRRDQVASHDSLLVRRVRAAGAVIMGKTNVPPLTSNWQTNNPLFGRTNNPWDLARTPGGSTGGGAAAVAAGLSPLEFGSDIGGSIRLPAAFCGIYGHRPSETALPRTGHVPGYSLPIPGALFNVLGPLARSPQDLELALDVAAGPDVGEDVAWRLTIPRARYERLNQYRVAILPWIDWLPVDREIRSAVDTVRARLRALEIRTEVAQPERFGTLREHHLIFETLVTAMFAAAAGEREDKRNQEAEELAASGDEFELARARGLKLEAAGLLDLMRRREEYRASYRDFFASWDILLAPITLTPPFKHLDDAALAAGGFKVNGQAVPYRHMMVYPGVATLSGQPATTFPAGLTPRGLPIGLQAIGPYLEDRTPIHFAGLLAHELGSFCAPPGYDAS